VPLDLVSGVSGGTLVGAYYCKDGRRGLQRCVENGLRFQLLLFGAMLDSRLIRWQVDWDLESARVEDLEVRLVAVTTALKRGRRPDAHAVCAGTLGEAVQASGAAPGLFSPTERRDGPRGRMTRYTDGYLCRLIPARVLPDYGADLVIAFNTIAGPRRRNPFGGWEIGEFLYSKTPVGRFIDFWVSQAFLLERCSDEVAEDAHLFIEPLPDDEPLLEALRFAQARQIVEQARAPLRKEVERCVDLWRRFRVNPAFRPGENAAASRSRPRKGAK
jgi:predicted acylesterase/phospholipase RssA